MFAEIMHVNTITSIILLVESIIVVSIDTIKLVFVYKNNIWSYSQDRDISAPPIRQCARAMSIHMLLCSSGLIMASKKSSQLRNTTEKRGRFVN